MCLVCCTGGEDEEDGDYTFKNSYSSLVNHLSKDLQIEINTPIAKIAYGELPAPTGASAITEGEAAATAATTSTSTDKSDALVTVTTKDGTTYRAKKIVVTASPHVINNKMIDFSPALPAEVAQAYTYTLMNPITKVSAHFCCPVLCLRWCD